MSEIMLRVRVRVTVRATVRARVSNHLSSSLNEKGDMLPYGTDTVPTNAAIAALQGGTDLECGDWPSQVQTCILIDMIQLLDMRNLGH